MSTLTSILAGDLISASRSTINTNFDNLNTSKAELTSPSLIGTPLSPTAAYGTVTTQIATTAFVNNANSSVLAGKITISSVLSEGDGTGSVFGQVTTSTGDTVVVNVKGFSNTNAAIQSYFLYYAGTLVDRALCGTTSEKNIPFSLQYLGTPGVATGASVMVTRSSSSGSPTMASVVVIITKYS